MTTLGSFANESDLAPAVELERPEALAADERGVAVAHHGPHVQTPRHLLGAKVAATPGDLPDDAHVDSRLHTLLNQADHLRIASPSDPR